MLARQFPGAAPILLRIAAAGYAFGAHCFWRCMVPGADA
jgi:hypothetical protein